MTIEMSDLEIICDEFALGQVLECVKAGTFCALLGATRSGKTAILRHAMKTLELDKYLGKYINLGRYEFFSVDAMAGPSLDNFFAHLAQSVVCPDKMAATGYAHYRNVGSSAFVRDVGDLACYEQHQVVFFLDHFEALPDEWGRALLGALRAIYDQRLPSSPHFNRITVVLASSVNIFEVSLGKISPLSIARMVTPNDLTRQQQERFLRTILARHGLSVLRHDLDQLYEATLGNRYLTSMLCMQWVDESSRRSEPVPFELIKEKFLSEADKLDRLRLMINRIEEDTDVLIQVLGMLEKAPIKGQELQTGLSHLELTGVARKSDSGFLIHNPLFENILRRHFTPERVAYLLDKTGHPLTVLQYLDSVTKNKPLGSYEELYLKVISDVVAWAANDLQADEYLLKGASRVFGITQAQMCHVSEEQMLLWPARPELSLHTHSLVRHALAQRQLIPSDTDPVTVAIPIDTQAEVSRDVLVLRDFCKREDFYKERDRLASVKRFSQEALRSRVRLARAEQFQNLQEATARLSTYLEDEDVLLQGITKSVCEVLSADLATIFLYDASTGQFQRGYAHGLRNPQSVQSHPRHRGISSRILESGRVLTLAANQLETTTKLLGEPLSPRTRKFFEDEALKVGRGYPIVLGENRIGVLYVGYRSWHFFRSVEDEASKALLNQAAVTISRSHLLQAIRKIAQTIGRTDDKSPEYQIRLLLETMAHEICRLLGVPIAYAWQLKQAEGRGYELCNAVRHGQGKRTALDPVSMGSISDAEWPTTELVVLSTSQVDSPAYRLLQQIGLGGSLSAAIGFTRPSPHRASVLIVAADPHHNRTFSDWDLSVLRALIVHVAVLAENARLFAKSKERLNRLEAILAITEHCSQFDKEEDLLQQVIKSAVQTIPGADAGSIHMLDVTKSWLEVKAHFGYSEDEIGKLRSVRLRVGPGYAGKAVSDKIPMNIESFDAELSEDGLSNPLGIQSALIVPIVIKGEPIGTFNIDSRTSGTVFQESDEKWLETLAHQVAIAVDRLRLIERQETELYTLGETIGLSADAVSVAEMVSQSILDLPLDIFQSILEKAIKLTNAERGNIRLADKAKGTLIDYARYPKNISVDDGKHELPLTDGIMGRTVIMGESVLAENAQQLQALGFVPYFQEDTHSELATPLRIGSEIVGVINLESTREQAFTRRDKEALERLSAAMAASIARIVLHRKASESAEQTLRRDSRGLLEFTLDQELRVSFQLRPFGSPYRSTNPISLSTMGMADAAELRHELAVLCEYIQMAYKLGAEDLRFQWLPWTKRIGVGFLKAIRIEERSILEVIRSTQVMGMHLENVLIRATTFRKHLFLPFELLYLEGDPLVVRYPLVRTIAEAPSAGRDPFERFVDRKAKQHSPVKVLLVGTDAREGMATASEICDIQQELQCMEEKTGIPVQITKCFNETGTIAQVKSCLKDHRYDIIHLAAEAEFDTDHPDNSGIVLPFQAGEPKCGVLRMRELAPLLAQTQPRFVYLSLCRGAWSGEDHALRFGSSLGILDALIHAGIPAVLGYRWDVTGQNARDFAKHFYRRLLTERSLELAAFYARCAMYYAKDTAETWVSPILVNQVVDEQFWTAEL